MPHELAGIMVKKTGSNPSVKPFYLSGSTSTSQDLLSQITSAFPAALSDDGDGALLAPSQATTLLKDWQAQQAKGELQIHSDGGALLPEMIAQAEAGHSMVIFSE